MYVRYICAMLPAVSVIGLGWLGMPLALHLQSMGYKVMGSVTTPGKRQRMVEAGLEARVMRLDPEPAGEDYEDLFRADILVINIAPGVPPSVTAPDPDLYARQIASVRDLALKHGVQQIIYISSTSVYPDNNGIVRETDKVTEENTGSKSIFRAEEAIRTSGAYALTVLRLGGLIGGNRIPGKHFSGKEQVAGHPPVNYIHRDDAVRLIGWVIEKELWRETFNGIAPAHPSRRSVYECNAALLGFDLPASYEHPPVTPWKEVAADKIVHSGFRFTYPDPLQFPYDPL